MFAAYQEDRIVLVPDLNALIPEENFASDEEKSVTRSYFAVFDGHGGSRCADFLANVLHKELASHPLLLTDPLRALEDAWLYVQHVLPLTRYREAEGMFYDWCRACIDYVISIDGSPSSFTKSSSPVPYDGSTATVCLIIGSRVIVVNCGDSSAASISRVTKPVLTASASDIEMQDRSAKQETEVELPVTLKPTSKLPRRNPFSTAGAIGRKIGWRIDRITEDHDTSNQAEVNRVNATGAKVRNQIVKRSAPFPWWLCCRTIDVAVGKPRVYPGGLIVTRSFGDFHSKLSNRGGVAGSVLCDFNKLYDADLESDASDVQFLVLASDGLWNAYRDQKILEIVMGSIDLARCTTSWSGAKGENKRKNDDDDEDEVVAGGKSKAKHRRRRDGHGGSAAAKPVDVGDKPEEADVAANEKSEPISQPRDMTVSTNSSSGGSTNSKFVTMTEDEASYARSLGRSGKVVGESYDGLTCKDYTCIGDVMLNALEVEVGKNSQEKAKAREQKASNKEDSIYSLNQKDKSSLSVGRDPVGLSECQEVMLPKYIKNRNRTSSTTMNNNETMMRSQRQRDGDLTAATPRGCSRNCKHSTSLCLACRCVALEAIDSPAYRSSPYGADNTSLILIEFERYDDDDAVTTRGSKRSSSSSASTKTSTPSDRGTPRRSSSSKQVPASGVLPLSLALTVADDGVAGL